MTTESAVLGMPAVDDESGGGVGVPRPRAIGAVGRAHDEITWASRITRGRRRLLNG